MKTNAVALFGGLVVAAAGAGSSARAEDFRLATPNGVDMYAGIGVVSLHANEIVYLREGGSTELSHLFWNSVAPVLSTGIDIGLPSDFTFSVKGQFGASGKSDSADYDWIDPPGGNYAFDNWTDRSTGPTDLDRYMTVTGLIGHDFHPLNNLTLNLNGGLNYTEVQWTVAAGGCYVYSTDSPRQFRDDRACPSDDSPGITFSQQIPSAVLGIDAHLTWDRWTVDFGAHGGLAFQTRDVDHHWLTNTLFKDYFEESPTLSLSAGADYALREKLHLFVAATFDQLFQTRGSEVEHDDSSGAVTNTSHDAVGTDLQAASVFFGVKAFF